jgi:hypothetical protein
MENRANYRICGGNIAFGRCLNCGVYPPKRRWWIVAAFAIITLAVLGSALQGGGPHHVVTIASFCGGLVGFRVRGPQYSRARIRTPSLGQIPTRDFSTSRQSKTGSTGAAA